jgi:CRP-like cAMP-binding protein
MPAVISGHSHLSSAVARTACEIAFIDCEAFRRLVNDQSSIWFSVLRQLSQDVNDCYEVIRRGVAKGSS